MAFSEPLPQGISPTRLGDFGQCPRKYQYVSIERRPTKSSYAMVRGRTSHKVFEQLLARDPAERTPEVALSFVEAAIADELTDAVLADLDDKKTDFLATLRYDVRGDINRYFAIENPQDVAVISIEEPVRAEYNGAPLYGILDRLDRDADGSLVIVDYKTGRVPGLAFQEEAFRNAQIYALLCLLTRDELPSSIRLHYIGKGQTGETLVHRVQRDRVIEAGDRAASAWAQIVEYYNAGSFVATPSKNACRFCDFKDICPSSFK